jgi:hypothetical protein
MKIDAAIQMTLVPGSIWIRKNKGRDIPVTVLLITNEGLPEDILEQHPQQVVFLTQSMRVQSMTIEAFLTNRLYSTMDTERESLLQALVTEIEDPEEEVDVKDIDNIQLPDELNDDQIIDLNGESDAEDMKVESLRASWGKTINNSSVNPIDIVGSHPFADTLKSHFVSYSEEAHFLNTGDTLHNIRFQISPKLTFENLRSIFGVGVGELEIDEFVINSSVGQTKVSIDSFIEVFLETEVLRQQEGSDRILTTAVVQVTSQGDIRQQSDSSEREDDVINLLDSKIAIEEPLQPIDQQSGSTEHLVQTNSLAVTIV